MKLRHMAIVLPILAAVAMSGCSTPTDSTTSDTSNPASNATNESACIYLPGGQAAKPVNLPSTNDVATSGLATFIMTMSAGEVTMTLDRSGAPCAVNSFASLVSQGYFDNTDCHRLVPGFVLQCGDPTGTGRGGPGYSFADETKGTETYARGTVAMANAGPNTNGSQFFIVLEDSNLSPDYDVLGRVDSASMSVIDAIAAKGVVDKTVCTTSPNDPKCITPVWGNHIDTITAD